MAQGTKSLHSIRNYMRKVMLKYQHVHPPPCIYVLFNRLFSFARKEILAPTLYVASLYSSDSINISYNFCTQHNQTHIIILRYSSTKR